jgi:hypothetical protein
MALHDRVSALPQCNTGTESYPHLHIDYLSLDELTHGDQMADFCLLEVREARVHITSTKIWAVCVVQTCWNLKRSHSIDLAFYQVQAHVRLNYVLEHFCLSN